MGTETSASNKIITKNHHASFIVGDNDVPKAVSLGKVAKRKLLINEFPYDNMQNYSNNVFTEYKKKKNKIKETTEDMEGTIKEPEHKVADNFQEEVLNACEDYTVLDKVSRFSQLIYLEDTKEVREEIVDEFMVSACYYGLVTAGKFETIDDIEYNEEFVRNLINIVSNLRMERVQAMMRIMCESYEDNHLDVLTTDLFMKVITNIYVEMSVDLTKNKQKYELLKQFRNYIYLSMVVSKYWRNIIAERANSALLSDNANPTATPCIEAIDCIDAEDNTISIEASDETEFNVIRQDSEGIMYCPKCNCRLTSSGTCTNFMCD